MISGWARALFARFCHDVLLSAPRGDVVRRITVAAAFMRRLEIIAPDPARVTPHLIVECLGMETMRRTQRLVSFISSTLNLDWNGVDAEVERQRLVRLLSSISGEPWAEDIGRFATHVGDLRGGRLTARTRYLHVRSAVSFMQKAGKPASEVDAADLRRFLRRSPGHAAGISAFARWLPGVGTNAWRPPRRRHGLRNLDRATVLRGRRLVAAAEGARSSAVGRALLAAAISTCTAIPLQTVLRLRACEADATAGFVVTLGEHRVRLPDRFAPIWRRWVGEQGADLAFPGRSHGRSASVSAVAYHVRAVVADSRPPRVSRRRID